MKTTVEIRDDLFRRAKAAAALRGIKLKDLIEESLVSSLSEKAEKTGKKLEMSVYDLMKDSIGIFDSGLTDLATNPKYLEGLGHDSMGHRRHRADSSTARPKRKAS